MKQNKVKNFISEEANLLAIWRASRTILTRDEQEKKVNSQPWTTILRNVADK